MPEAISQQSQVLASSTSNSPPTFKDFKFKVIGQQPDLLKRFSAPGPGPGLLYSPNRSPSPSRQTSSEALNTEVDIADADEFKQGGRHAASPPDHSNTSGTPVNKHPHQLSVSIPQPHITAPSPPVRIGSHLESTTTSPFREESLQLQYPSPTPAPIPLVGSSQFQMQATAMDPPPHPLRLQHSSAPPENQGQSFSALRSVQQSFKYSFATAQSSLETATSMFTSAFPTLTNTQSSFARTSLSLLAAESSIQASEGALEAAEAAFDSARSAFEAANKAMVEASTVMHKAKKSIQATKEVFRNATEEYRRSEITIEDVKGVWDTAKSMLEDVGMSLSKAEGAETRRSEIEDEMNERGERERAFLERDAKLWRNLQKERAKEQEKRKEEDRLRLAQEQAKKEKEDAEKRTKEAEDRQAARDAQERQNKQRQEKQAQEELERQRLDYETKRNEVMQEKKRAQEGEAARINAMRSSAQAHLPAKPASANPLPVATANQPMTAVASPSGPTSSPMNKARAISGGVAVSVLPTPSVPSTKKNPENLFVAAQTEEGKQVSTDRPLYPIEMASETTRSKKGQHIDANQYSPIEVSRSSSPDVPLSTTVASKSAQNILSSPSLSLAPGYTWQPEPGDVEMDLANQSSSMQGWPSHAQMVTNLRHLGSSGVVQRGDVNAPEPVPTRSGATGPNMRMSQDKAQTGRQEIVVKQENNEDESVSLAAAQRALSDQSPEAAVPQESPTIPHIRTSAEAPPQSNNDPRPRNAASRSSTATSSTNTHNTVPARHRSPPKASLPKRHHYISTVIPAHNISRQDLNAPGGSEPEPVSPLIGDGGWDGPASDHRAYSQRNDERNSREDDNRIRGHDYYPPVSPPANSLYPVANRDVNSGGDYIPSPARLPPRRAPLPRRRSDHYSPPPLVPPVARRKYDHYSPRPVTMQSEFTPPLSPITPPLPMAGQKRSRNNGEWTYEPSHPTHRPWREDTEGQFESHHQLERDWPSRYRDLEHERSRGWKDWSPSAQDEERGPVGTFVEDHLRTPPYKVRRGPETHDDTYQNASTPLDSTYGSYGTYDGASYHGASEDNRLVLGDSPGGKASSARQPESRQAPARDTGARGFSSEQSQSVPALADRMAPSTESPSALLARLSDKPPVWSSRPHNNQGNKKLSERLQSPPSQSRGGPHRGRTSGRGGSRAPLASRLASSNTTPASLQDRLG